MGRNGGKTEAKVVANQGDWEILLEEQVEVLGFFSQDFHQHSVIEHFSSFKPQGRLTLLEVYTDWAGPCTAMATILAKVKVSKRESNQLKKNIDNFTNTIIIIIITTTIIFIKDYPS